MTKGLQESERHQYQRATRATKRRGVWSLLLLLMTVVVSADGYAANKTWTGAVSTDFGTAGNWSDNTTPSATDDIIVPIKANQPLLSSGTYTVHSVTVQAGATFTITAGTLTVSGASIQVSGTLNQSAGTIYADRNVKVLSGGIINESGTALIYLAKTAGSAPGVDVVISTGGVINQSGGTIYTRDYATGAGTYNQTGSTALFKIYRTWKPGAGNKFNATSGTVEFTGTANNKANFATGTRQFNHVIVDAGVNPGFDNTASSTLPISGNFTNNNTTLNHTTSATFTFNGSAAQTIYSAVTGATNNTFGHLVINNNGNTVTLSTNVNIAGNLTITSGTFNLNTYTANRSSGTGALQVQGTALMRLAGNTGGQPGSNFPLRLTTTLSGTSTVEYYGSGQTIYATPLYGNMLISSAGTKTATAALTIVGNFTLNTATFVAGSYTHNLAGNWNMNSGSFTNTGSTINFNGSGAQTIYSTGAFNRIIINKTAGSTTLTSDVTASTVTFTKGSISTNAYKVIIPSGGSVTGAASSTGWINGNLQKYYSATAGGTFEIGGPLFYTPVTISFASVTTAGSLIASALASTHPQIGGSTIASKNISRYWQLTKPASGAISYTSATLGFSWNTADNYSGMTASLLKVANYSSSAWSYPVVSGTPSTTSISCTGVTNVGDFAVGETSVCTTSAGFNYTASEMCSNGGTAAVTINSGATAGSFTSTPAGLSITSATGAINLAASSAGTYTVTNTVTGACTVTSTKTVKVTAAPAATIFYIGSPYCKSGGTASVSQTGTAGGTYSSTYGLVIDASTGTVDLALSDAGTYTVSYTVAGASVCGSYIATALIVIKDANYAVISYNEDAYCLNGGTALVSFEGTTGGTFSSTAGLSLNSTTGAINLAASTPNTYTITYSGAAAGGCAAFTATTTIPITSTSPASIVYTPSSYCINAGKASATITGTTGGTFSSSASLSIDDISGDVTLGTSTAGSYTVSYSLGGCNTTAPLSIIPAPSVTIGYSGTPFCTGTSSGQAVTLSGTTGGTFSAPAGVSINSLTGAITPSTSTAGSYLITYTIAASGGCSDVVVTTPITIASLGTWTGAVSTTWANSANWQCGIIPDKTINVIIPSGLGNYPLVTTTSAAANNITLQTGSSITILNGKLSIAGTVINSGGSIAASQGKVEFAGAASQSIPASLFKNNIIKDLVISGPSITLQGVLKLSNSLSFGNINNSTFNTGSYLTLGSTTTSTAYVADITNGGVNTGNGIIGNVTVERFILSKRAFRFLAPSVTTTTSLKANWMENANNSTISVNNNPNPGYGTHITGAGSSTNGFDATNMNSASMFTYVNATQLWSAVPNTNFTLNAGTPYRIMIRGSRSVDLNNNTASSSETTLRTTGKLVTGTVVLKKAGGGGTANMPELNGAANSYSFIANPYASPISWNSVEKTDVAASIFVFDPTVSGANGRGAYITYNTVLRTTNNAASAVSNDLQPGQAFFVQATGTNPTITFKETHKSTAGSQVFKAATPTKISVQLLLPNQVGTDSATDGTVVIFDSSLNNAINPEDSYKFGNLDENIAIRSNDTTLSIEGRKMPTTADTIKLRAWQLSRTDYVLKISTEKLPQGIAAYLEDTVLNRSKLLSNGNVDLVPFSTGGNVNGAMNRFRIVFKATSVAGRSDMIETQNASEIKANKERMQVYPNPVKGKVINLLIGGLPEGRYSTALIAADGTLVYRGNINHTAGARKHSLMLTQQPAQGIYVLEVEGERGKHSLQVLID